MRRSRAAAAAAAAKKDADFVFGVEATGADADVIMDLTADGPDPNDQDVVVIPDDGEYHDADVSISEDDDEEYLDDDEDTEMVLNDEQQGRAAGSAKPRRRRGGGAAAVAGRRSRSRGGKAKAGQASAAGGRGRSSTRGKAGAQVGGGSRKRSSRAVIDDDDDDTDAELAAAEEIDLEAAFDSEADAEEGSFVLGAEDEEFHDYSGLELKSDHPNRPLWVCPDGRIFLETFSPVYKQAYDFLIAVAEPVSRPEVVHEYVLTPHSLYAAVSIGLDTATILSVLDRLSKARLPPDVRYFVRESTSNYGKVKLVLQRNRYFVESPYPQVLRKLLKDSVIRKARVTATIQNNNHAAAQAHDGTEGHDAGPFVVNKALKDVAVANLAAMQNVDLDAAAAAAARNRDDDEDLEALEAMQMDGQPEPGPSRMQAPMGTLQPAPAATAATVISGGGAAAAASTLFTSADVAAEEDPERETHSFEIEAAQVEHVKARCLPDGLNYPMLEEYDFRNDIVNPTLHFDLKPHVKHRPYQEKSLSKMFGNSRARSGIIVLPCGAGKSLVGVSAAARIKKATLCLCTNAVSVDQWKYQFQLWTSLREDQVCRFTSDKHEWFAGQGAGVCITTYTMVAYSGRRSEGSEKIMNEIVSREWGLILLDEVHVVPAMMFRKVLGLVKAHCKLGLTATLVREDQLIADLNFLIGPKLYEANWLDLTRAGHIASVQCAEVWCPMTQEFMREYLRRERTASQRQLLYVMNPTKLRACQYLVQYHEARGDKVIVFSDNLFALREYAIRMRKPFLYGGTGHQERTRVLHAFKTNPAVNTVFLSKVGDNSLDIPEANVLIQVSSHGGSRRQEAQRLGRILRKKRARPGAPGSPGEEFDAFFYTLVSTDTQEVFFTSKRQQFLIDQGYSYKVIPSLLESVGGGGDLLLGTREDQIDLLAAVLHVSEAEATADDFPEKLPETIKGDGAIQPKKTVGRRMAGSMAALSGALGIKYMEYSTKTGGGRGSTGAGRGVAGPSVRKGPSKLAKFRRT